MKKIIHISDLHVGYTGFKEKFSRLIRDITRKLGKAASQYVIVITGDLVDNSNKREGYGIVKRGLARLRRAGFQDILVIPGNHDYGTGNKGNKKYVRLFKEAFYGRPACHHSTSGRPACHHSTSGRQVEYPKLDIVDSIAFIGLDSMAEELHWYDELWAQGELGKKQLTKLENILTEVTVRGCKKRVIYLHHHPFKWRPLHQLKDSRSLKKVLSRVINAGISIDALLFGHNHQGDGHNGTWGIERCYDGGTATLKPRPRYIRWAPWFQVKASTRVIDLEKSPESDYVLDLKGT